VIPNLAVSFISRQAGGIIQAYWNPARMDADYARIRALTNAEELDSALREINRRTYAEYAFVPIAARAVVAAVGSRVAGWSPGNYGFSWSLETVTRAD
jgi:ABC-type transport system substrate-binding protein